MTDAASFAKLDRSQRVERLKEEGEYLGQRRHGGHQVHLYRMPGYFVEMYLRVGLNWVDAVEIAKNIEILTEYVPDLDQRDLFR